MTRVLTIAIACLLIFSSATIGVIRQQNTDIYNLRAQIETQRQIIERSRYPSLPSPEPPDMDNWQVPEQPACTAEELKALHTDQNHCLPPYVQKHGWIVAPHFEMNADYCQGAGCEVFYGIERNDNPHPPHMDVDWKVPPKPERKP